MKSQSHIQAGGDLLFWAPGLDTNGAVLGKVTAKAPARSGDVTPNLALVHKPTRRVSRYASYAESFTLPGPTFEDALGRRGRFSPTQGDNHELGAQASFWGNLLAASLSVFDPELHGAPVQSQTDELNSNGTRFYRPLDHGRQSRDLENEFSNALRVSRTR